MKDDWTGIFNQATGNRVEKVKNYRNPGKIGEMNKLEALYAEQLELEKLAREIWYWYFQPFNLRLGYRHHWRPDFFVVSKLGNEIRDTKGHIELHAKSKMKTAAVLYPEFIISHIKWINGNWKQTIIRGN